MNLVKYGCGCGSLIKLLVTQLYLRNGGPTTTIGEEEKKVILCGNFHLFHFPETIKLLLQPCAPKTFVGSGTFLKKDKIRQFFLTFVKILFQKHNYYAI